MKRILVIALALLAIAATSSFAATLYDLGTGAVPTGVTTDGSVVSYSNGTVSGANIWSGGTSYNIGGSTYTSTAGAAKTTYTGYGSTPIIVAANTSTTVQLWAGNASGVGTWSTLPASDLGAWTASSIAAAADGSNFWVGGATTTGSNAMRYAKAANSASTIQLPPGYGAASSTAAVSDNGLFIGNGRYAGARNGFVTDGGNSPHVLNNLAGAPSSDYEGVPKGISRDGTRGVGFANRPSLPGGQENRCVIWDLTVNPGTCTQIPFTGANTLGYAQVLNQNGTVAYGFQQTVTADRTAWIWDATNGTRNLQTVLLNSYGLSTTGWQFNGVTAVSGDGNVLSGTGYFGGVAKGWVVTIPEPGSLLALATGLIGFLGLRKRF